MRGYDSSSDIQRTKRWRRPGVRIGSDIGGKLLSVSRPAGRALWGSAPRRGWPRRRFMHGNGGCGDPGVESSGDQRTRPWFPFKSSMTPRLTWEGWKSSGLAASCYGCKVAMHKRSALWWLLFRQLRQHEGHGHADLAFIPSGLCQDRSHRYAKVVRGLGRSGGARTGPAGGIRVSVKESPVPI